MRTGKRPQLKVTLPEGWWPRLQDLAAATWRRQVETVNAPRDHPRIFDVYDFIGIDRRSISRGATRNEFTEQMLARLVRTLGYERREDLLADLGPAGRALFRHVHAKSWQEIRWEERPHPYPAADVRRAPFGAPNSKADHISGWTMYLCRQARYVVIPPMGHCHAWPELEFVLYERVPRTAGWARAHSCGAVTSGAGAPDFAPHGSEWLATCWGKQRIDRNAPWWAFEPAAQDLDAASATLTLTFAAPTPMASPSAPRAPSAPSIAAVRITAVE